MRRSAPKSHRIPVFAAFAAFLAGSILGASLVPTRARAAADSMSMPIVEGMLKLRDPFKRPTLFNTKETARDELEKIPVDKFKLLGVVTGPDRLRAMVGAPNNKTYFVHENMKIGMRRGVITKITPTAIRVQEHVVNVLGQDEVIDSEITLPAEGDGKGSIW